jgi:hypothetical protein
MMGLAGATRVPLGQRQQSVDLHVILSRLAVRGADAVTLL